VPPGEYYVAVISYGEEGSMFELRAAAYVEETLPDTNVLTPNVSVSGTLEPFKPSGDLAWQYAIDVAPGADHLLVRAWSDDGVLDVFVGEAPVGRDGWGGVSASYQLSEAEGANLLAIRLQRRTGTGLSSGIRRPLRSTTD
jgi:hypothetical protein